MLFVNFGYSQTLKEGWTSFDGYIRDNDIVVNIHRDNTGFLMGDYCYKKNETRIPLKGRITGTTIFLDEFTDGKITAKFSGKINEKDNTVTGKFSSTTHSDMTFFLSMGSWTGNSLDNRYGMTVADTQIELFFKRAKTAILANNKTWLAKNVQYPFNLNSAKKKIQIKDAKSFLANYSKIVTKDYQSNIRKACVCDIFANTHGAMIGSGALWINETKNHKLKIIAINN